MKFKIHGWFLEGPVIRLSNPDSPGINNTLFKEFENLSVERKTLSTFRFSNSLNIEFIYIYLRYKCLKLSTRIPVDNVFYLIHD